MGSIYFNKLTGQFWESTKHRRKPPNGFEKIGFKDYRYGHKYAIDAVFCSKCKVYHYYFNAFNFIQASWIRFKKLVEQKIDCKVAEKLSKLASKYPTIRRLVDEGKIEQAIAKAVEKSLA